MTTSSSLARYFILIGLTTALGGCAGTAPTQETLRFCDQSGCSERPASSANAVYSNNTVTKSAQVLSLEEAAANNAEAAYDLALHYFRGDGVQRDSYQALQWMRKAGDQGLLEAQKALGGYYLTGFEEMGSDPQEAEKWLSMAAAQGDEESAARLVEATEAKQAVVEDYKTRREWEKRYREFWYGGYPYLGRWHQGYWYY